MQAAQTQTKKPSSYLEITVHLYGIHAISRPGVSPVDTASKFTPAIIKLVVEAGVIGSLNNLWLAAENQKIKAILSDHLGTNIGPAMRAKKGMIGYFKNKNIHSDEVLRALQEIVHTAGFAFSIRSSYPIEDHAQALKLIQGNREDNAKAFKAKLLQFFEAEYDTLNADIEKRALEAQSPVESVKSLPRTTVKRVKPFITVAQFLIPMRESDTGTFQFDVISTDSTSSEELLQEIITGFERMTVDHWLTGVISNPHSVLSNREEFEAKLPVAAALLKKMRDSIPDITRIRQYTTYQHPRSVSNAEWDSFCKTFKNCIANQNRLQLIKLFEKNFREAGIKSAFTLLDEQ